MEIETSNRSVFDLPRGLPPRPNVNKVCRFWLSGRCTMKRCRFLHSLVPIPQNSSADHSSGNKLTYVRNAAVAAVAKEPDVNGVRVLKSGRFVGSENHKDQARTHPGVKDIRVLTSDRVVESKKNHKNRARTEPGSGQKLCQYWVDSKCVYGDKCRNLHSWFSGSGLTLLTKLERDQKAVFGITLPSGSNKLFSAGKDGSVCAWDCSNGQCVGAVQVESEIGCIISEGPLVFAGLRNAVKVWNIESNTDIVLPCPGGLVNAIILYEGVLFAGMEDGSILAWKSNSQSSNPEPLAALKGHNSAVMSLVAGGNRLFSGSSDQTIRVWDLQTLECIQTLTGHNGSVTSLICWDKFLFSGSTDKNLKVWGASENGSIEVIHVMEQESGILSLRGMSSTKDQQHMLLCSGDDNTVRMYELPSLAEKGRTFSKGHILAVETSPEGLFFTGDSTGQIFVWKLDCYPS